MKLGLKIILNRQDHVIPDLDIDTLTDAIQQDDGIGFCVHCGAETSGVEPDAREYKCDNCDELGVYGAEELLIMVV